ncbi:MAG TPA: hypothetical protein VLB46_04490 [Pyrinomonadaceae bacterium]|nr:hypothetical protein [Pyrinomonadaceae bacterium]
MRDVPLTRVLQRELFAILDEFVERATGKKYGQFDSVRKMLLYADTILIPDPILPWLESERPTSTLWNFEASDFATVHRDGSTAASYGSV